jgi:hypothetical protein
MSGVVLMLGPVAFQDFEVPAGINFGGRQLVAVHQLTDGQRIVDSIGPAESEISFSGVFSGADATSRARMLNSLRVAGGELSLTWDVFLYTVVLSRFDAGYENLLWIPYRISCTVVRDEAEVLAFSSISLGNSILADLSVAGNQCVGLGLDFTNVEGSLANPAATTLGSTAYVTVQLGLSVAQSAINTQIGSTETALQVAISPHSTSVESLIADLIISTTAAGQLANLTSARAYLARGARNLLNASS